MFSKLDYQLSHSIKKTNNKNSLIPGLIVPSGIPTKSMAVSESIFMSVSIRGKIKRDPISVRFFFRYECQSGHIQFSR